MGAILKRGGKVFCDWTNHREETKRVVPVHARLTEEERLTRRSWNSMRERCNPSKGHPSYAGRGITVCDRWLYSYENFRSDMGLRMDKSLTIDRIDGTKGYDPTNCRWATKKEQARNRAWAVWVEWEGKRRRLPDLCDDLKVQLGLVHGRIRAGWTLTDALFRP